MTKNSASSPSAVLAKTHGAIFFNAVCRRDCGFPLGAALIADLAWAINPPASSPIAMSNNKRTTKRDPFIALLLLRSCEQFVISCSGQDQGRIVGMYQLRGVGRRIERQLCTCASRLSIFVRGSAQKKFYQL